MRKPSLLVIRGSQIELDFDELEHELSEILQDEFSYFESELSNFHKKHGFLPEEGDDPAHESEEETLYWKKYLRVTDKIRKKLSRAISQAILKL